MIIDNELGIRNGSGNYQPYWNENKEGKKKRHRPKGNWEKVLSQAVGAQAAVGRANVSMCCTG